MRTLALLLALALALLGCSPSPGEPGLDTLLAPALPTVPLECSAPVVLAPVSSGTFAGEARLHGLTQLVTIPLLSGESCSGTLLLAHQGVTWPYSFAAIDRDGCLTSTIRNESLSGHAPTASIFDGTRQIALQVEGEGLVRWALDMQAVRVDPVESYARAKAARLAAEYAALKGENEVLRGISAAIASTEPDICGRCGSDTCAGAPCPASFSFSADSNTGFRSVDAGIGRSADVTAPVSRVVWPDAPMSFKGCVFVHGRCIGCGAGEPPR